MTELIIRVDGLEKVDFSIFFYVDRERTVGFRKEELIKVYRNGAYEFYAPVDANFLGRGHLMAAVEIEESEPAYPGRKRRVTVSGFTGYSIPCLGEGNTIDCGGYYVSFERVADIPKGAALIYYGVTASDFDDVDWSSLQKVKETEGFTLTVNVGERIIVAIPNDREEEACKDNGFGEAMPFSTAVDGVNGREREIDGIRYRVFGELMIVDGKINVYIR